MKIKDLDYFTQLINLKNFTAVANYFSVSQPTITYAVKRLEAEFETELIVRDQSHQGIIITLVVNSSIDTPKRFSRKSP